MLPLINSHGSGPGRKPPPQPKNGPPAPKPSAGTSKGKASTKESVQKSFHDNDKGHESSLPSDTTTLALINSTVVHHAHRPEENGNNLATVDRDELGANDNPIHNLEQIPQEEGWRTVPSKRTASPAPPLAIGPSTSNSFTALVQLSNDVDG